MIQRLLTGGFVALLISACAGPAQSTQSDPITIPEPVGRTSQPEAAPTQWKECLPVLYVYVECQGDYRQLGNSMQDLIAGAQAARAEPNGPPFGLFYDDPGATPMDQLRSRLCIPVSAVPTEGTLPYDVLQQNRVVYTTVQGPYPELPRVYPTLFKYMASKNWVASGPIREIYFSNPAQPGGYDSLMAEVQIPWMIGQ